MRTVVAVAILATGLIPHAAIALTPPSADCYVSINGSDAWSGTLAEPAPDNTDGPFRTLERARDQVRKLKAEPAATGTSITVLVRAGVYTLDHPFTLDARDSGAPEAPVLYQACPGENVILAGGPTVPPHALKPVTDPNVLNRLDPAARHHALQADLHALGITHLDPLPPKYQGAPANPELFFNDQRMTLARWPNQGWTTIARIIAPGACPRTGDTGDEGGVFEYSGERPSRWNVDAGVWLHGYWCYDWYAEVIQVQSINPQTRSITLAAPSLYSVRQGNPAPRRFYALNLLEELDQPGEYFIDTAAARLYFWPPAPLADARIVLSTLKGPVVAVSDAADLTLRGFIIEASLGNGIDITGGTRVSIQACEVRNTRELGINVSAGVAHNVEACDIHDTGTGGIVLSGGDRKTLTPAGHTAVNNHIWRFSRHKLTYSNALLLQGVGNRAAHNLIHDAPHQAVGIAGNDHVFEYNIVHHVCLETDDCGACYKGRNPSCRGNIIRYNFWHDIGSPMGHGAAAIYFDDGDGGDIVFGNVFLRAGDPGQGSFGAVFSHGGHDILAENNIFIDCKRALGSAPWTDQRWKETVDGGHDCFWQDKLLKEVDITKPPYTTRYPELVGFMDPKPGQPRVNRALRNVFVNCPDVSSGNWQVPTEQNYTTETDPGFVNAPNRDFQLKPDSIVFSKLPDFQPIPFHNIGPRIEGSHLNN